MSFCAKPKLALALLFVACPAGPALAGLVLDDPLYEPPRVGARFHANGGAFIPTGWQITGKNDFIIWHIPTVSTGAAEFDVVGLNPAECRSGTQDHTELFHMYDWTFGNSDYQYGGGYRDNPYKQFIRKTSAGYWGGDPLAFVDCRGNPKTDSMEILWQICPGEIQCSENHLESDTGILTWNAGVKYNFRMEWVSTGSTARLKTFRRYGAVNELIMDQTLPGTYAPTGHSIRIGASNRGDPYAGAPIDAVFSNLKIFDSPAGTAPGTPTITTPISDATVSDRVAFIKWIGESHSGFQVRINTQNDPESGILWDSGDMLSPKDYAFSGTLPDNATCYAFVRLSNSAGYGGWTAGRRFTVNTAAAPPGPSIVGLDGDVFKDHQGYFKGLGVTYMQAMRRCKYDRPRFHSDLAFLAGRGFNSPRILSMVGWYDYWDGYEIAPVSFQNNAGKFVAAWPDYWQQFRDCIDIIYDHGMRAEVTIFADAQLMPNKADRIAHMSSLLQNLAGREHKVLFLEVANEAWQNGFDGQDDLREFAKYLADRTEIPVAITSDWDTTNQGIVDLNCGSSADLATVHFDRDISSVEGGWLPVRDSWRDLPSCVPPMISNEPIGPGSSVATENDPIKLVSAAIFAWIANLPGYVFHSNAGVRGDDPFEGVHGIYNFAHLEDLLPGDLSGWVRNDGLQASAPFTVYANGQPNTYWPGLSNPTTGVVRNCGSIKGEEFICLPMGIRPGGVDLQARKLVTFTVYNPLDGSVHDSLVLNAGDVYHLDHGPEAWLIKGVFGISTEVFIDLGSPDVARGMTHPQSGDGETVAASIGGRTCRRNADPSKDYYFYFGVNDGFAYEGSKPELYIIVDYYDEQDGCTALTLDYDSDTGDDIPAIYKFGGQIVLTNSGEWKQHVFHLTDAWFGNRQNSGADFRLGCVGGTFHLDMVLVTTTQPLPPVIEEVVPDPEISYVGQHYSRSLSLSQGYPAPAWTMLQGPPGAQVSTNGVVSWSSAPGQFGLFTFEVRAANALGSHDRSWQVRVVSLADFDHDGDVDMEDFGFLQGCLGEQALPYAAGCGWYDLDADGDVDVWDLTLFAACLSGAELPPACLY